MKLLVLNGPNLNLLGIREPQVYGEATYESLVQAIRAHCAQKGVGVEIRQSNHEGVLVDEIQGARAGFDGIVLNAAAYSHTSIALLDALKAVALPAVEVHLTDIHAREPFRHVSYPARACLATISGKGIPGYLEAIDLLAEHITKNRP